MRVLVVEDDATLAEVVGRGLREEGYAVDLSATLAAADLALSVNDYDLIVLDLGLPDGDGIALCQEVRSRGLDVRILMLTARGTLDDRVVGLDAGAGDYLAKPFDFAELAARLRALLRRPAGPGQPVLQCGGVRLDPAAHRVWRDDVVIPLTPREFSLLYSLMSRPGQVVTRTDLLEQVWDAHYDGLSNVVDVHVASLRRKLGGPGRDAPVETVRGVGYRMAPDPSPSEVPHPGPGTS